jgi:hypothetical protein
MPAPAVVDPTSTPWSETERYWRPPMQRWSPQREATDREVQPVGLAAVRQGATGRAPRSSTASKGTSITRNRPQIVNGTNTLSDGTPFGVTQSLQTDYFASGRGRLGIAADRNLFYVTGGIAFTHIWA